MKPRTVIPLIIGLGVGVMAIKMGVDVLQRAKGSQGSDVNVVVFEKRVDPGTQITDAMIRTKRVPSAALPGDAMTEIKAVIGRVASMTIPPGLPVSNSMLAPPGSKPGLRGLIPVGKRAVTVSVDEAACVGGFVTPGSRVDVSAVDKTGRSRLILSDVEVGAVGQSTSEVGPDGKSTSVAKSVTLFVDPEQVQAVHAHTGNGKLKLALRGNGNDPDGGLWSKLLAKGTPRPRSQVPTPQQRPQYHVVEILRGTELQRVIFDGSGNAYPYEEFMARQNNAFNPVMSSNPVPAKVHQPDAEKKE